MQKDFVIFANIVTLAKFSSTGQHKSVFIFSIVCQFNHGDDRLGVLTVLIKKVMNFTEKDSCRLLLTD